MAGIYIYKGGLETERLFTRFLVYDDYKAWSSFFEDKDAVEFLPSFGFTTTQDRAKHMIQKQLDRYKDERFGLQVLIEKETNNFIGLSGLLQQEVDDKSELEVGYHIFKKYWGRGYATEAARCFCDYGFKNNLSPSIVSVIDVGNIRSQRVAVKNGMLKEKQIKMENLDVFIYRTNTMEIR